MDDSVWEATSAREKVILWGLVDWVELERVHDVIAQANPTDSVSVVQYKTLELIRSLVSERVFLVGDLNGPDHRFAAWNCTLDESLQRIRGEYVDRFEDTRTWPWYCWLDLTDEGVRI